MATIKMPQHKNRYGIGKFQTTVGKAEAGLSQEQQLPVFRQRP